MGRAVPCSEDNLPQLQTRPRRHRIPKRRQGVNRAGHPQNCRIDTQTHVALLPQCRYRKAMRSTLRAIRQHVTIWAFCLIYIPMMITLLIITLGQAKATLGSALMRGWGWGTSWLAGVSIEYTPSARAVMNRREARVITFNHSSTLDLLVGATLVPQGGITIAKKELRYIPLVGQVTMLLEVVFLARKDRQSATASLRVVADRIVKGRHSVLVSPEGTRSADGRLGPFKLGPFHLAIAAQVPIIPIVIHGCYELMPRNAWVCKAGTVQMDALPPIPTVGLTAADAHALADQVRAAYVQALASGPQLATT